MKVTDWLFGKGSNWDDEPLEQQREAAKRFIAGIAQRDQLFKQILRDQIIQQAEQPQSNDGSLAAALDKSPPMLLPECDQLPTASGPFGKCLTNPIPVNGPVGEIVYLNRLLAPSGCCFFFHRIGSQVAPPYPHPVDAYELLALDGSHRVKLFFAMYHPRRSQLVPDGLHRTSWNRMNSVARLAAKMPVFGTSEPVHDFPWGLPEVVRSSPAFRKLDPAAIEPLMQGLIRAVNRIPRQEV